ncbi:Cysteine-rich receptor-like protein kinase 8 [Linum perenne]
MAFLEFHTSQSCTTVLPFHLSGLADNLIPYDKAKGDDPFVFCGTNGNYTSGSTYQQNLNLTLSSLVANVSLTGYYTTSNGEIPDAAYGLIQCRAYLSRDGCQTCVDKVVSAAIRLCPYQRKVTRFSGECSLQYADWSFFAEGETSPVMMIVTYGGGKPENQSRFSSQLVSLIQDLSLQARDDPYRLATGNISYLSFRPIFAMVECVRDLSGDDCFNCLQSLLKPIPFDEEAAQVSAISCNARYGPTKFFRSSPLPSPLSPPWSPPPSPPPPLLSPPSPPPRSATSHEKGSQTIVKVVVPVALIVIAVALVLILIPGTYYCFFGRRDRRIKDDDSSSETLSIPFTVLQEATCKFSDENKLGQGGFGVVYKGKMLDGKDVAVKRLLTSSSQGLEELKTEVMLVAKLEHTNLVRLLGFCIQGKEKLLVYEYLPSGSLDHLLFDKRKKSRLNWETRYKIIVGIARGMQYLHEDSRLNIIHRDLKGGNILLDEYMNPKISDFGTARLFSGTQSHIITSRVAGTRGYMSPEYVNNGIFSTKSDVYSFGILILEIITGDRISSPRNYSNLQSDRLQGNLPDGRDIAVKRLSTSSKLNPEDLRTEVMVITKLMHKNLVRLLGFCFEEEETMLVYEYLPNGSLEEILYDTNRRFDLDWGTRYKIIIGIARGMLYLHEDSQLTIIHRGLKSSNILLDASMTPKIADFGLARVFLGSEGTQIAETKVEISGYMAPEYAENGQFSVKSDVYSFGILLLEIVTGERSSETLKSDKFLGSY